MDELPADAGPSGPHPPYAPGWRIDYQMTTAGLAEHVTSAVVERAATYTERWSDHAPVTCVFDWDRGAGARPSKQTPDKAAAASAKEVWAAIATGPRIDPWGRSLRDHQGRQVRVDRHGHRTAAAGEHFLFTRQ